jgi:predicted dehydrogenase
MSRFVPVEELFKGRHFNQEIVVLCVRWYLSFKLSFRDLVAMAGKDVYVEKSPSLTVWEGRKMIESSRKTSESSWSASWC